jgi:hypothetical protein
MFRWLFFTALGTMLVIAFTMYLSAQPAKMYYYNAYSLGYDEYFVIKSYQSLPLDTLVHFDDQAIVTDQVTGYQAKILSPYTSIH